MDINALIPPRKCTVLEKVLWSGPEKVLRVSVDIPLPAEPFHQEEPIKELLLSFCSPSQSMADVGQRPVMVDILVPKPNEKLSREAPLRIAVGTLHVDRDEAMKFSPIEKNESVIAKRGEPSEAFIATEISFIGEQSGGVENSLKKQFSDILKHSSSVRRAYLARISYGNASDESVALCINSTSGIDAMLQESLGRAFTETFRPDQHIDILFLEGGQEAELKKVCKPFYES